MEERRRADDRGPGRVPPEAFRRCGRGIRCEPEQGRGLARIDELRSRPANGRPGRRVSRGRSTPARPRDESRVAGEEPMSPAQAAYLKELADEEGGEFDPSYSKNEAARRIGELLIRQMSRISPTEPSRR